MSALSRCIVYSTGLDKYGLVVQDLPDVLETWIKCLQALESFVFQKKLENSGKEAYILMDVIKSSLYHVLNAFGKEAPRLYAQGPFVAQFKRFLEYKE